MTLIYLGCAWLVGIYVASLWQPPLPILWLLTLPPAVGLILGWRKWQFRMASLCLLTLVLGSLRYSASLPHLDPTTLAHYNDGDLLKLRGIVVAPPDVRDRGVNLEVAAHQLELEGRWQAVSGKALVRVTRYPAYHYGDELEVEGRLETPPEFEDFSYRHYLARKGIHSMIYRPDLKILARGRGNPFYTALYAFRDQAQEAIALTLPEPQASLLTGILLGVETGIPSDLMDDFNATGTSHIIAISGFNIAIVAGLLSGLGMRLLGRRRSVYFAVTGIILYTILVGANAAVVRAAIMGILYVVATHFGRQSDAITSLVASAMVMTLLNPLTLWDVGFQLSFAATLGLILFTPPLQKRFEGLFARLLPEERPQQLVNLLNEALIVTLAAQVTTLPIIVHNFHRLSMVTLLTNFLILPAQPGVMIWGGMATILALVYLPFGKVLAWMAWLFLTYTIGLVELTAKVPHASVEVGRFGLGPVWLYYGLLGGVMVVGGLEPSRRRELWQSLTRGLSTKMAMAALLAVVLLTWAAALSTPDGYLHVSFLDVGEGDAIFIQTPSGQKLLIDGGPSPTVLMSALGRRLPFWDRTLDLVVLTHPNDDHLAGLIPVLERYQVRHILDTGQNAQTPSYERWWELIREKGIPTYQARSGVLVDLGGGLRLELLHPPSRLMVDTDSDVNNNSAVLRLVASYASFLFTGDIEVEAEKVILGSGQELRSLVLKVPHHGSNSSSSVSFLRAADPQLAIISVGADNRFGHPSPEVLDRLAGYRILRTDQQGDIEVVTDGERYWVETEE
ncbi:MAG: DNA internalization-related competence protein ComEC/Rec2 [Anaerolineae bacterium]